MHVVDFFVEIKQIHLYAQFGTIVDAGPGTNIKHASVVSITDGDACCIDARLRDKFGGGIGGYVGGREAYGAP